MVQKWWVACAALLTVLSGCLEGEAPDAEPLDSDPAPTDPADGNQTAPPTNGTENAAPTASLEASAQNGTAPLNVTFTLGGSDPDGDNLTWTLTVGNDTVTGDVLPASVNRTLAAGNHTVTLTVSDGDLTGNASLLIAVAVGGAPAVEPILQVLEMVEGCYLCIDSELATGEPMGAEGCVGWNLEENELDCGWVAIPDGYAGTPFSVYSYTSGTLIPFGTDGHPDVEFRDSCSPGSSVVEQVFDQGGDKVVGVIPEGAKCIVAFEFHWPNVGHTIEVSLGAAVHA